jgi:FtsZ-binding cell division protein ZapB
MEGNPLDVLEEKIRILLERFSELKEKHAQILQELQMAKEKIEQLEAELKRQEEEKTFTFQKIEGLIEKINQVESL